MTQQLPEIKSTIEVRNSDYVVLETYRLSDKLPQTKNKPYGDNISITAKKPRGKKRYSITLYPNGVYSEAVIWP